MVSDKDMQLAILGSSDIKIGGQAEPIYRRDTAALFPVEPEAIGTLQQGEFYIRLGDKPPFKLRVQATYSATGTHDPCRVGSVRQGATRAVLPADDLPPPTAVEAPNRPLKGPEENPFTADVV